MGKASTLHGRYPKAKEDGMFPDANASRSPWGQERFSGTAWAH